VRPFEKGNMVILTNGKISKVVQQFGDGFWIEPIEQFRGNIWIDKYNEFEKVKTVREPRKGGKEARDIVAMIGREHHKYLLSMLKIWVTLDDEIEAVSNRKDDYWRTRKRGVFNRQSMSFMLFQKTKTKLGA